MAQMTGIFCRYVCIGFTCGNNTIVTTLAICRNPGVVVTTVRVEREKSNGGMTVITFGAGYYVLI